MAKILPTSDPRAALAARDVLLEGGLVIYPTDTVYGVGVDAENKSAVEKLFTLKRREEGKAVLVMVFDLHMASRYVEVTKEAQILAEHFLPGPLSIVLPQVANSPLRETLTEGTLGIRIPKHSFCSELSQLLGRGITSTSVNYAGQLPLYSIEEMQKTFGDNVELIVDGGVLRGLSSTVVDLSSEGKPQLLREGAVSQKDILGALS